MNYCKKDPSQTCSGCIRYTAHPHNSHSDSVGVGQPGKRKELQETFSSMMSITNPFGWWSELPLGDFGEFEFANKFSFNTKKKESSAAEDYKQIKQESLEVKKWYIDHLRDYFGEYVALYFGFLVSCINGLIEAAFSYLEVQLAD